MTSSIVKYSVERFFLVKTFWLKKKFPNQLQMIQKVKKTVAGQIRSAGRSGRPTDRQNRRPFFTFWIIKSRFGKRIFQPKFFTFHDLKLSRGKKTVFAGRIQPKYWRLLLLL